MDDIRLRLFGVTFCVTRLSYPESLVPRLLLSCLHYLFFFAVGDCGNNAAAARCDATLLFTENIFKRCACAGGAFSTKLPLFHCFSSRHIYAVGKDTSRQRDISQRYFNETLGPELMFEQCCTAVRGQPGSSTADY